MSKTVKNIIRVLTAITVLAAAAAALFWALPTAVSQYRHGAAAEAEQEGRVERAIELLLPELDRNPKDSELRVRIVEMYISLGNHSRAEYLLEHGIREQGGQTGLYKMLCGVYVMQDKLLDAVELLENLPNPRIQEQLNAERPAPPVLTPPPGDYRSPPALTVTAGEGTLCCVTLDGKIPSIDKNPYKGSVQLPQGRINVLAVAVGGDGLVSDWAVGMYVVDDLSELAVFAEPAIEAQARGLTGVTEGGMVSGLFKGVTELVIPEARAYMTLDDLRWFPGLETLSLVGTGDVHTDISALAGLENLKSLTLKNMGIDSISLEAIAGLETLESLDLSGNQIVTLGNLSGLTALRSLTLENNSITDLAPIAGLTAIEDLMLGYNGIEETQPLAGLTALTRLHMQGNRVRDLQGLSGMKQLLSLNLERNSVVSAEPLAGLTSLVGLSLSHNKELYRVETLYGEDDGPEEETEEGAEGRATGYYNSLAPLGSLTGLQTLLLDACGIEDITPLAPLTALRKLSLNDNAVTSVKDAAEGMVNMEELLLNRNQVKSLIPLQAMSKLEVLHIEYNGMPSLIAIRELPSIKTVYAFGNPVTERVTFTAPNVSVFY